MAKLTCGRAYATALSVAEVEAWLETNCRGGQGRDGWHAPARP